MCLIILAHQVDVEFPLLLAANRDEFHLRPTRPADFWQESPELLAGKDLQAGGTWMGITRQGRFAAITNYRDPEATAPGIRSRGELTLDYLNGKSPPEPYLSSLLPGLEQFAPFSLLVGDGSSLWYLSNVPPFDAPVALEPGVYGLSNAHLDTPWPKVELGKTRLQHCLRMRTLDHDSLSSTVSDPRLATDDQLDLGTEPGGEAEHMLRTLSAQFIRAGDYGTRACTTLRIDAGGSVDLRERCFDRNGMVATEQRFRFNREN